MENSNNIINHKNLKKEFLLYLETRIPDYRVPASIFFSSINTALKNFAKKQGHEIKSILDIDDIQLLRGWQGILGRNDKLVYNNRHNETKAQEGLRYYIDFLQKKEKSVEAQQVVVLKKPNTENVPADAYKWQSIQSIIELLRQKHNILLLGTPNMDLDIMAQDIAVRLIVGREHIEHLSDDEKGVLNEHIAYYSSERMESKNDTTFENLCLKAKRDINQQVEAAIIESRFEKLCDAISQKDKTRLTCSDKRDWLAKYDEKEKVILVEGDRCSLKTIKFAYYDKKIQDIEVLQNFKLKELRNIGVTGDVAHVFAILKKILEEKGANESIEKAYSTLWEKVRRGDIKTLPMKSGKQTSRLFVDVDNKDTIYFVQQNDGLGINIEKVLSVLNGTTSKELSRGLDGVLNQIDSGFEIGNNMTRASLPYVYIINEIKYGRMDEYLGSSSNMSASQNAGIDQTGNYGWDALNNKLHHPNNVYIIATLSDTEPENTNELSNIFVIEHVQNNNNENSTYTYQQRLEGRVSEAKVLRRYRNRAARNECLEKSGYTCYVCGFNFERVYGDIGKEFLEVHHKKPLATYSQEHEIPVEELCALCSNCHSMVHRKREVLDVGNLKKIIAENKKKQLKSTEI